MRLDSVLIMKQRQTKRGANKRFNELGDQQNVKVRFFLFFFLPDSLKSSKQCFLFTVVHVETRTSTWPRSSGRTQTHTAPSSVPAVQTRCPSPGCLPLHNCQGGLILRDAAAATFTLLPQPRGAVCRHVLGRSTGLFVCCPLEASTQCKAKARR